MSACKAGEGGLPAGARGEPAAQGRPELFSSFKAAGLGKPKAEGDTPGSGGGGGQGAASSRDGGGAGTTKGAGDKTASPGVSQRERCRGPGAPQRAERGGPYREPGREGVGGAPPPSRLLGAAHRGGSRPPLTCVREAGQGSGAPTLPPLTAGYP